MTQREPRDVSPNPEDQATTTGANPGNTSAPSIPARSPKRLVLSPIGLLLGTLALFFVAETIVMLLVIHPLASDESPLVSALIDSGIMVSLGAPFLWLFIARSHRAATAVVESEARYKSLNLSLEERIRERTQDLEALNAELKERNRQLLDARSQAATDVLTSVPNHRSFQERIRNEVKLAAESGSSTGLIMLDIDGFKKFNDSLGHVAGDGILRHCADVLVDTLGRDAVFRYGGDEFAVILFGADEASALETAERLRRAVEARNDGESCLTISLGVASIPETATTAEDLVYKADAAMYQAKAAGKNRVAGSSSLAADKDAARPEATQAATLHR